MQIFREKFQLGSKTVPASPIRELYGKKTLSSGRKVLVAPLDIVLMQNVGGVEIFQPPKVFGNLIGASVATHSDLVGSIIGFDYPPTNLFDVKPVVFIQPDTNFDLTNISEVKTSSAPSIHQGDPVTLILAPGLTVAGKLVSNGTVTRNYPEASSEVQAYRVDFDQTFLRDVHGARIVAGNALLGILIATQNQRDGSCHTLVFPAEKV